MSDEGATRASRLAVALAGIAFTGVFVGTVLAVPAAIQTGFTEIYATDLVLAASFATIGVLVAKRRSENPIGWLFLGIAVIEGVAAALNHYAIVGLSAANALPGSVWAAWLAYWLVSFVVPSGLFLLLLIVFPNGRPISRRWVWLARAGLAFSVLFALSEIFLLPRMEVTRAIQIDNPTNVASSTAPETVWVLGLAFLVGGVAALVVRFRRSHGEERQQLRWFVFAVAVSIGSLVVLTLLYLAVGAPDREPAWFVAATAVTLLGIGVGVPVACGVAVLRYRLWDLDVVVRKTLLYASLAILATLVYLAVVVGAGAWLGRDNSLVTMVAAVVVALTFHPARTRLTHLANRLVYGRRATPYEVLSDFAERVGETFAIEDLLPRMARTLGEGTGAWRADVWLRVGDELRPAASWPHHADRPAAVELTDDQLPPLPGVANAFPVRHRGELLGALTLEKPPADPLSPVDQKLVADLASQAGLVLRNVGLTAELEARIEDLRALQKRLVSAQDEERRRLERNLHDGAQQQLVALTVKARLVRGLLDTDPGKTATLAAELEAETQDALENLRDLARGIYPPLLADRGLAAALESQARKSVVPVSLAANDVGRHPPEVEAAAYFCVLEALNNISKYARASGAAVRLAREDGHLVFEVADDGVGFDQDADGTGTGIQGMADRLAAVDGMLEISSALGAGTTVTGRIPIGAS